MPQISNLFATRQEQIIPVEGNIKGWYPPSLQGRFLRVGPAIFDWNDFTLNHFFDGMAMVSKFDIKNGKVSLSQKTIESETYQKLSTVGRNVFAEFGTHAFPDTTKGFLFRMFNTLVPTDLTDNNVTGIYSIEDEIITASQTCFVHSIDADSLATKERHDLMKSCGTAFATAHPLTDSDGAVWNVGSSLTCKYHVIKIPFIGSGHAADALKGSQVVATIPSSWTTCFSFISSFALLENHIVFVEGPLLVNCVKLAQIGIKSKALKDAFEWTPSEKPRFIIVEKESGKVIQTKYFAQESFFAVHIINSFVDRDDQIVLDLIGYPNSNILDKFNLANLRNNQFTSEDLPQTYRFVIPIVHFAVDINEGENLVTIPKTSATAMKSGEVIILTPQMIGEPGPDFPIINQRFQSKPYRYFYATGWYAESKFKNAVCKMNVESGRTDTFKVAEDEYCGQPAFVPTKDDPMADEDDGVLLVPVSSNDIHKPDFLACLDGKTFQELGRAEFETKFVQGLHGIFKQTF